MLVLPRYKYLLLKTTIVAFVSTGIQIMSVLPNRFLELQIHYRLVSRAKIFNDKYLPNHLNPLL
jgi:hypothetical protein